jgi:hypothetical protein
MKTKAQWKSALLWLSLIFGLVVSGAHVSEARSSELRDSEVKESNAGQEEQAEFRVKQVTSELVNDVYRLNALIEYDLSNAVLEALVSGVPITIELQMEVVVPREWIWDKNIAKLSQQYRIEYYALTDQYLVTNLNSQSQNIYASQQQALDALGVITELPLIDSHLLKGGEQYYGQLRARLMIEELPAPLRVLAYLSSEWRLASEWTTWRLQ